METVVIIATIALLVGLGVPAVRAFIKSFETGSSTKSMISAALSSARAIAAKEQKYAGVRFQKAYQPEGPLEAPQYMVFIINDSDNAPNGTGLANGFRVVQGLKPIRLPDTVGVMDLKIVGDRSDSAAYNEISLDNPLLTNPERDEWINEPHELTDTTTFSIIFSPSGKLVIHRVQVRNKNGKTDNSSNDDIFNRKNNVDAGTGMFYQDDYFGANLYPNIGLGLGPEPSRHSFIIYDTKEFKKAYLNSQAWSEYLSKIAAERIYINAYMGTIIERD